MTEIERLRKTLKEHRLRLNLTQRELAEIIDVPQSTLCDWECGRIPNPSVATLVKWATGLHLQIRLGVLDADS